MPHHIPLITTLAAALGLALLLGFVAVRLRLPALVGYLLAGTIIGPHTPGFVADLALSMELAEIGVMLLMFGVGLHFSLSDLHSVRRVAAPGALLQMTVATCLGLLLALWWGWSIGAGLVFGLSLSVASTVVLLRALEDRQQLDSPNGRIAVGWLLVEDLAMVLVLVLLPALSGWLGGSGSTDTGALLRQLGTTLLEVAVFVALMLIVGKRLFPWLLWQVARTGSRELFTLCVIAAAVGIAYGSAALFSVSFALGAFFAGMVLRESALSHRAAEESLPLRDAFAVLFFVSVGMLFDPAILWQEPLRVLLVVLVIMLGKTLAAFALVRMLGYPLHSALTVSISLAQIGEFSFILVGLGSSLGLLPAQAQSLILAGAMLSIAFNPLLFALAEPWRKRALARATGNADTQADPLSVLPDGTDPNRLQGHVVLLGYGELGRGLHVALASKHATVIAEIDRDRVEALRAGGQAAVWGDAAEDAVLVQTHVARARALVLTFGDPLKAARIAEVARMLNPGVQLLACADSAEAARALREAGFDQVIEARACQVEAVRLALQAQARAD